MASIVGGAGNDTLFGTINDDVIDGLDGDDSILADAGADTVNGGEGNDTINGGAGVDLMLGGLGDDQYIVDSTSDVVAEADGEGIDTVLSSANFTLGNYVENLTLTGASAITGTGNGLANYLTGNGAANTLVGGAGRDTLVGGAGNDRLEGGADNDFYIVDSTTDIVFEIAGGGTDVVESSATFTLSAEVEHLFLTGVSAINGTGNISHNSIVGNGAANSLSGMTGNDTLSGGSGDDRLSGGAGFDYLDGGLGADTMTGGTESDSYVVDNVGDVVTEFSGQGNDQVFSSVNYTLLDLVENLWLAVGGIVGTGNNNAFGNYMYCSSSGNTLDGGGGNDYLYGGAGTDSLFGNSGNDLIDDSFTSSGFDTLSGGTGSDTMMGGSGDTLYVVDNAGDVVIETYFLGNNTIQSSVTFTLVSLVEDLVLTGVSGVHGTGNELDNHLTGNTGNNTLAGGLGNDTLDGGAGNDTLQGGQGDDTYYTDAANDSISENASEGTDTVMSSVSRTLAANFEHLTLIGADDINGTGNTLNNVITGNVEDNSINGGAGDDTMQGGAGNDNYGVDNIGDLVVESASEGVDEVFSSVSWTLADNIERLDLTSSAAINGIGNDLDNRIRGSGASNYLEGGLGNDTLDNDGGMGSDTLVGGLGNDVYVFTNGAGQIVEAADEGVDRVEINLTHTLGANFENLTLTGSSAINGYGNAADNSIAGNSQNNVLSGEDGNDTINGGGGADTINGGDGNDDLGVSSGANSSISGGLGNDLLAASFGNDTLVGDDGNDTLTGGSGSDSVVGGTGNDFLDGSGSGPDTLAGGAGDDIYEAVSGDVVVENAAEGLDTVRATSNHTLDANVENLDLISSSAIWGTGNGLDNLIDGSSANNSLSGLGGNDTLIAGDGLDTLSGGAGNDVFHFEYDYGSSIDVISDFVTGADIITLDDTEFPILGGLGLEPFGLPGGNFAANAGGIAGDADDYVLYDTSSGRLYYDEDGNGAGAREHFATLTGAPTLAASDIQVVD